VIGALPFPVSAQSFSPLSAFQSLSDVDVGTLQVKLTFVGAQERQISTVLASAEGSGSDVSVFGAFRRPGVPYAGDLEPLRAFAATTGELRAIVAGVAGVPEVASGAAADFRHVSFALAATKAGSTIGFEAIVDPAGGFGLFTALRTALVVNTDGLRLLNAFGCHAGLLEAGTPVDVSPEVSVALRGVRWDRATGSFVGTAVVTNDGIAALEPPVSLVLELPGNVHLRNASGFTCATSPEGRDYVDVAEPIAPGASAELVLEFSNSEGKDVAVGSVQVLSGPGAR
jgi:hypothetical protein